MSNGVFNFGLSTEKREVAESSRSAAETERVLSQYQREMIATGVKTLEEARESFFGKDEEFIWPQSPSEFTLFETLTALAEEARPTLQAFGTGDDRDDIARYGLCLILEAAELINALPWKRWSRNPSDMNHAATEFADTLCFVGSLVCLFERLGISVEQLTSVYLAKVKSNRERFAEHRLGEGT